MKVFNISNFNQEFNEFALAKMDIENIWKIKEGLSLNDFMIKLNLSEYAFVYNENIVIPFTYIQGYSDKYLFYTGSIYEDTNKYFEDVVSNLIIKSKFNLTSKLKKIDITDLALNKMSVPEYPFFIIKNQYYTFLE